MKTGIGFLIVAMALTPMTDGFSKILVQDHNAFFVVFARYLSAGIFAVLLAVVLRRPIKIPKEDYGGQVFRTGLMMGAMAALIYALSLVPLAKAVGGFLIAPVVASLISVVLFKERMCAARLAGAVLSFLGAYIILRPEAGFEMGTLMALFGGALLGAYLAATRRATIHSGPLSTLIVQCFLGAAMIAPLAFLHGIPNVTNVNLLYIAALAIVSAINHFLTVAAYHRTDSSVLAPFFYFNIVFAIPVGYFWFGEIPTPQTLVGLAAIGFGGVLAMASIHVHVGGYNGVFAMPVKLARKFNLKI